MSGGLQKTLPKNINNKNQQNTEKLPLLGAPETRNEQGTNEPLVTFAAPGAPGTPLGHPWGPKWSQDLPQEPLGPLRTSIFDDFLTLFDDCSVIR